MDGVGLNAAGGAAADFGAFFAEHHREVGLLTLRLCGRPDVAEEITADAFAEASRRWDELTRSPAGPAGAMGEIVGRLVHERADRTGRRARPSRDTEGEPDGVRVRALLAERLTLVPLQDAPTVVMSRITDPAAPAPVKEPAARLRRPGVIVGVAVGVAALGTLGALAMSGSAGRPPAQADPSAVSVAQTDAGGVTSAGDSPSGSAPASARRSASASASASASPSASPSASLTASATPTVTAGGLLGASTAPATPTASAAAVLTASGSSSDHGNNSTWSQLEVTASIKQALSTLTVTVTVASCPGLRWSSSWTSGSFASTHTTNGDGSLTYVFTLSSGDEAYPGSLNFAAQFTHNSVGWNSSADSYSIVAVAAGTGATSTYSGGFSSS